MRGHDDVVVRSTRGEFKVHPLCPPPSKVVCPFLNKKERVPSTNDDDDDDDDDRARGYVVNGEEEEVLF